MISIVLAAHSIGSQISSLDASNRLAARLVDLFNGENASGIKALALPEFFKTIPEDRLPGLIKQVHSFGTMQPPELLVDLTEQRQYKITIKHEGAPDRNIVMNLGAEADTKFYMLSLGPYFAPATKLPGTDNLLKTPDDMVVQSAVSRFYGRYHPVGLSIGILNGSRERYFNYGEVTTASRKLPTRKTVFEIGSVTKTMTGELIARAVLDGKLNLDADIRKYLPSGFANLAFEGKPILLRHLVTHSAGLPANPPGISDDAKADAYEHYTQDDLLNDLEKIKLTRAPGSQFSYSNMGAGLCRPILENACGATYESLLRKHIFGPAKMEHSGIALTPEMNAAYATPYGPAGEQTDRWIVNGIGAAGAVRSTTEDMLRYAKLNFNEQNPMVGLSHKTQTPDSLPPVALFWLHGNSRLGGSYVNHEGGTGGFTSHILVFPSKKIAVVVMMNSGEQKAGDLAYEIALSMLSSAPK